ncbi:hypothetical protein NB706_003424 [Xanthomonas sacchari]|nr:hypothetical protein [Xanthomonas sacchari]
MVVARQGDPAQIQVALGLEFLAGLDVAGVASHTGVAAILLLLALQRRDFDGGEEVLIRAALVTDVPDGVWFRTLGATRTPHECGVFVRAAAIIIVRPNAIPPALGFNADVILGIWTERQLPWPFRRDRGRRAIGSGSTDFLCKYGRSLLFGRDLCRVPTFICPVFVLGFGTTHPIGDYGRPIFLDDGVLDRIDVLVHILHVLRPRNCLDRCLRSCLGVVDAMGISFLIADQKLLLLPICPGERRTHEQKEQRHYQREAAGAAGGTFMVHRVHRASLQEVDQANRVSGCQLPVRPEADRRPTARRQGLGSVIGETNGWGCPRAGGRVIPERRNTANGCTHVAHTTILVITRSDARRWPYPLATSRCGFRSSAHSIGQDGCGTQSEARPLQDGCRSR